MWKTAFNILDVMMEVHRLKIFMFPSVAKILIGFEIDSDDILFDKIKTSMQYKEKEIFKLKYTSLRRDNQESGWKLCKKSTNDINKDNIILLLDIKPDFIEFLGKYKSGLGNGKEKKALIAPIINALAERAKEVGIADNIIESFKRMCFKELDALIYTDEKIIIDEVNKMKNLIKKTKNKLSNLLI